jgi:predicted dehydrogenase
VSNTIRWGVIGSGGIARRRTIPEGITKASNGVLSAVFDKDSKANADMARQFNVTPAADLDELLAKDIDAVYVATPAHLHYDHVQACAKARKHVLCEKPLGLTVAQAREMIDVCDRHGVKLGCAFMMRFVAQHQEALKLIQQGRLGRPVYARAQLSCWYPPVAGAWRQDPATGGGGSLMDMGGHCIDLLEMFFGNVARVSCSVGNTVHSYRSEDSAVATLFFENGALATVDTFFCIPDAGSRNVLELYGSQGSILAQGTIGQGPAGWMVAFLEGEDRGYEAQQTRTGNQGMAIDPKPANTYQAEIEEFSAALLNDRAPSIDGALGLRSQKILAACYESARLGRIVEVV